MLYVKLECTFIKILESNTTNWTKCTTCCTWIWSYRCFHRRMIWCLPPSSGWLGSSRPKSSISSGLRWLSSNRSALNALQSMIYKLFFEGLINFLNAVAGHLVSSVIQAILDLMHKPLFTKLVDFLRFLIISTDSSIFIKIMEIIRVYLICDE